MTTNPQNDAQSVGDEAAGQANLSDGAATRAVRKRKRRISRRRRRRVRVASIAFFSLVLVSSVLSLWALSIVEAGNEAVSEAGQAAEIRVTEGATTKNAGFTVTYKGEVYELRDDMVSVAVIGYDKGAGRTSSDGTQGQADGIVLLALDLSEGKATVVGIPRDAMVDVGEYAGDAFLGQDEMQVCLAFSYGTDADSGARLTAEAISHLLYGMPVNYYFALDMDGVGALANAVDGVPITALSTIPNTAIVEGEPTVLYGANALTYLKYRDMGDVEGSLERQERQAQFAREFAARAVDVSGGAVARLLDLYNVAADNSVTNLNAEEYVYLATRLLEKGTASFGLTNLDVAQVLNEGGHAAYYLDEESLYETVLNVYYQKQKG